MADLPRLKISGNKSYGVMKPNLKNLVQSMQRYGQEKTMIEAVSCFGLHFSQWCLEFCQTLWIYEFKNVL